MTISIKVKLSEIIEGLEFQSDEARFYLNKETGELICVSDEEICIAEEDGSLEKYPEWQHDLIKKAKEILEDERSIFIALPSRFDIDEYSIMEKFALSVNDEETSDYLYAAIKGKGAFRRFKDEVRRFGIEEDWNRYRDDKYKELAMW